MIFTCGFSCRGQRCRRGNKKARVTVVRLSSSYLPQSEMPSAGVCWYTSTDVCGKHVFVSMQDDDGQVLLDGVPLAPLQSVLSAVAGVVLPTPQAPPPKPQARVPLPCPSPAGAPFSPTLQPSPARCTHHTQLPTLAPSRSSTCRGSLTPSGSQRGHPCLGGYFHNHAAAPKTSYPSIHTLPSMPPFPLWPTGSM